MYQCDININGNEKFSFLLHGQRKAPPFLPWQEVLLISDAIGEYWAQFKVYLEVQCCGLLCSFSILGVDWSLEFQILLQLEGDTDLALFLDPERKAN